MAADEKRPFDAMMTVLFAPGVMRPGAENVDDPGRDRLSLSRGNAPMTCHATSLQNPLDRLPAFAVATRSPGPCRISRESSLAHDL